MFINISLLLLSSGPAVTSAGLLPNWLSKRAGDICNAKGTTDFNNNYFQSASKSLATYAGCSARCANQARCKSFGYSESVCMLFDERLSGNFEADKSSDLIFFDVGCVSAALEATPSVAGALATSGRNQTFTNTRSATRTRGGARPTLTTFEAASATVQTALSADATATSEGDALVSILPVPGTDNSTIASVLATETASSADATATSEGDSLVSILPVPTADSTTSAAGEGETGDAASAGDEDTGASASAATATEDGNSPAETAASETSDGEASATSGSDPTATDDGSSLTATAESDANSASNSTLNSIGEPITSIATDSTEPTASSEADSVTATATDSTEPIASATDVASSTDDGSLLSAPTASPDASIASNATSVSGADSLNSTATAGAEPTASATDIPSSTSTDNGLPAPSNVTITSTNSSALSTTNSSTLATNASVPDGCNIPQTFTVTDFSWFNSSTNLDCVNRNFQDDSTSRDVCWDAQNQLCDTTTATATCTCAPQCAPDSPAAAYQPKGYGPADHVSITLNGLANGTCQQSNPQSSRRAEVGDGNVDCGSASNILNFYGDSTQGNSAVGKIDFHPPAVACNGQAAVYGASFALSCSSDEGGNSTCTTALPLTLNLMGFAS